MVFQLPRNGDFVVSQLSIWALGHIAVPVCHTMKQKELDRVMQDTNAQLFICEEGNAY